MEPITETSRIRRLLCHACGDVIGVYEPLVSVVDGRTRSTSRAAEPHVTATAEACYHAACSVEAPERAVKVE